MTQPTPHGEFAQEAPSDPTFKRHGPEPPENDSGPVVPTAEVNHTSSEVPRPTTGSAVAPGVTKGQGRA